jgi:glycosyltransferase involved in cell wall biosynthesis
MKMRVALLHYHLKRGGVTSVIKNQARALMEAGDEALVIAGEDSPGLQGISRKVVEELRYDSDRDIPPGQDAEELDRRALDMADRITGAMQSHWGSPADIIHVHNPLLHKNAGLIRALNILQERGFCLLLQNHDLPEDFRPNVYSKNEEYPVNCHYAVINSRDRSFLQRAGLKPAGLHLLPNEVRPIKPRENLDRNRYVYPVRALQRKNIGEALLFSLFIPKGRTIAITLPPTTERDLRIYRKWTDFAGELGLQVEFDLGLKAPLEDVYGSALGIITTSVKEGFGFSYLEPWTAGRTVIGRRLNYVCRDFENAGVQFDSLYSSLEIPMVYISPAALREKLENAMLTVYKRFGVEPPRHITKTMWQDMVSRDSIDFSRLDEQTQGGIIRVMAANKRVFQDIADLNPFLRDLADWKPDEDLVEKNRQKVRESYGREPIFALLRRTYQAALQTPVAHKITKSILLELYLDPAQLSPVSVGHD